ncbi:MAG: family 78 glycoside hydrolase catalytic domain [Clostridia bacterium]|nr:family 78 glycoside hydrolase catalytic domain [Clostridia bacterium]
MRKNRFMKILSVVLSATLALVLLAQPMLITAQPLVAEALSLDNHAPGAPFGLLTNESEHPMNIESAPMFDWWVNDVDYDEIQTAYQIRLYDGVTDALVWDSGKVASSAQNCVPYTGDVLKPGYPYSWEVKTWDSKGAESPYSERAEFATGLGNDNWEASWIKGIREDSESPLSVIEEDVEDVILSGEGFALQSEYADWDNYEVITNVTLIGSAVGVAFRTSLDGQTGYVWQIVSGVGLVRNKVEGGKLTPLGDAVSLDIVSGKTFTISIRADGNSITTAIDGTEIDKYTDESAITSGTFGFYTEAGHKARINSLTVNENYGTVNYQFKVGVYRYTKSTDWTDYTMDFDMVIDAKAAGIMFRCADNSNGYMWQFSTSEGLKPHIQKNNSWTKKTAVACSLVQGQKYHVTISLSGNVFTTYLDGELISTFTDTDSTYSKGMFGIRQGSGETFTLSNLVITAPNGSVLGTGEDFAANYSKTNSSIVTTVDDALGYTADFSESDLSAWVATADTLPLTSGAQKVYWAESRGDGVTMLNYGYDWTDFILSLDVQVSATSAGIVFRAPDSDCSGYMWAVRSDGKLRLHKGENGKYGRIGTTAESDFSLGFVANKTYHLTIKAVGDTIYTYVDGVLKNTKTSDISFGGSIGFRTDGNEAGIYTNVTVTDLNGKVLFADDFGDGARHWGTSGELNADNSYWYSRKEATLESGKEVKHAIAYVAGSQDYELTVNGIRIGRAQTYDYLGETKYQGWDITDAVKGRDKAAFGVLTSYFGGAQGRATGKPGLLAKFVIYYLDGTSQTVVTDETWLTHDTAYSNLGARNGEGDEIEYCDGRLVLSGWAEVGYDTNGWMPVNVHGAHPTTTFYNLQPEIGHVKETRVQAVKVMKLADGTTVADFGKVIPARIIIHFPNGTAGTQLTVQEGYELNADGSINTSSDSTQSTNMTYVYTMKDGEQTFEAWGYLGFRYASVPAEAGELTAEDFEATVVHAETVTGRESTLDTSDEMLDQVFELMKRSALYSVQNQFVDTPTREKGQFLYDAINISAATMTGSYERQMTRKAILQFLDSADRLWSDESKLGMYNAVYPSNDGARDIPEFTLNMPRFVWRYYLLTGDIELLEYAYPYMVNTAGYVTRNINTETGLVTAIQGGTSSSYKQGIIDTPPDRFGYDWSGTLDGVRTTINAHSVRVYEIVADMAYELGYTSEAILYNGKADALRSAMNEYLLTESGVYCDGLTPEGVQSTNKSQHATSHAIVAGAPDEDAIDVMLTYIANKGMRQGTTTADLLLEALFANGRGDAAVRLLTNPNDYGWAKIISRGGTFIWENWHGSGSQSHGWGAASLWQVIEYISGVKILEAGAKTIRIDPAEGNIDEVNAHTVTARGAVDVSYSGSGKDYVITIEVPANMTAEVVFPLVAEGRFVEIGGKNGTSEFTEDAQVMTVGSGKRTFVYQKDADPETPAISTASVTVGQNLAMNYIVAIPEGYAIDSLTMEFTMNGKTTVVRPTASGSDRCTFVFTGIAPQCMGDNITARLYSGDELIDAYETYSVKAYADKLLTLYADNENITNLVTDMLNYGAEAQKYRGYKTDALVNRDLDGAATASAPTESDDKSSATKTTNSLYSAESVGVRFDYDNKIFFRFKAASLDGVTVTDGEGKSLKITSIGDGKYMVYSDAISALEFDKTVTFNLNVNGETAQTVTYSVNTYAFRKANTDSDIADLALALYRYGVSAVRYDESN